MEHVLKSVKDGVGEIEKTGGPSKKKKIPLVVRVSAEIGIV